MKSICALILIFLSISSAVAQAPVAGSLLVATDELRDPRFAETVILILHYGSDGALGVAINRPTWVGATEAFPDMQFLDGYTGNVYFGGPLAPANLVTLARIPDIGENELRPVVDDIYVSADPEFLDELIDTATSDQTLRVYAGHAGWEAGQLDSEITAGSWQVVPANAEVVFATEPLALWEELRTPETELTVYRPHDSTTVASR
jgi:putative transcriptional regulator